MIAPADTAPLALEGVRILDLSGRRGQYCGKLFGDLGAEVILVEPPNGSSVRREGPFVNDRPGVEASLSFAYLNTSKRGITLDLDQPEGQKLLKRLCARADIVIESEKPGIMVRRGLGYDDLKAVRSSLVYTSLSAFGSSGPYADYEADDLTALALGGMLYLGGYTDSPPIAAYGEQAYAAVSLFGAVATMAALYAAETSGEGDLVDVSMQECVVMALENAAQTYDLENTVRKRYGGQQRQAAMGVYACKDGFIYLLAGGLAAGRFWPSLAKWLVDAGAPGAMELQEKCWLETKFIQTQEAMDKFAAIFEPFVINLTKDEIDRAGKERRIPLSPITTPADVLNNRQLRYRKFFVDVWNACAGRDITMPGAPYKLLGTPWRISRPAPALGQHNLEIYGELGLGARELQPLTAAGVI